MVSQGEMDAKDPLDLNLEGVFTPGGGRALVLNLKALSVLSVCSHYYLTLIKL